MTNRHRSFDQDAHNVVGLIRQGREPGREQLKAIQEQQEREQQEFDAQCERDKRERIKAVADMARKADAAAIFARAFANIGNAGLAEKWAITAYRRRRESIAAAWAIRHLVFTPEEIVELHQST
ncbi:MAG: hypothetical protein HY231_24050 [Acidobacteria bacterium]|nr:hypothetical protein [Acidobacteriota bacterium]